MKQKRSKNEKTKPHDPFASGLLKDPKMVAETLIVCVKSGDVESFREVLAAHLMTRNKNEFAKMAGLSERSLADLIDLKKEFDPRPSTVFCCAKSYEDLIHAPIRMKNEVCNNTLIPDNSMKAF